MAICDGNAIRYAVQGDVDGIHYKLVSADGLRFARTASIEPLKPIKINNLGWQLCQERAIIAFLNAIVAPNSSARVPSIFKSKFIQDAVRGCKGQKLPALRNRIFEWRIHK